MLTAAHHALLAALVATGGTADVQELAAALDLRAEVVALLLADLEEAGLVHGEDVPEQ